MRSFVMVGALGLLGCVSFPSAHLVIDASLRETVTAPVVCGPMGFRKTPLQSRWGEYVRVTVGSRATLRGTAFVHANGLAGESRTWTTADGNLVIEARFENLDPDARYALLRDRPIDVTITNLEALDGTCEGAVFTVEQGELIPNIDERSWVAELERRGGGELVARREALRLEMEARRQAHYAAWEARRAEGATLVADVAVREAHYAAWEAARRPVEEQAEVAMTAETDWLPMPELPRETPVGAAATEVALDASVHLSAAGGGVCAAPSTSASTRVVTSVARGSVVRGGSVTCGASTALGSSQVASSIDGSASGGTFASSTQIASTSIDGSASGGMFASSTQFASTSIDGSASGGTFASSPQGAMSVDASAPGTLSSSTQVASTSIDASASAPFSSSTQVAPSIDASVSGGALASSAQVARTDAFASSPQLASTSIEASGASEWSAYPALVPVAVSTEVHVVTPPPLPAPAPVVASVVIAPQPSCDEACEAANTLGFVLPAVFDVLVRLPSPQPVQRVVQAVPLDR